MSDKKINDRINRQFNADVKLVEEKISYAEFKSMHTHGDKEKWGEMPFIAKSPFLLKSFLKKLNVPERLRAVKDLHGFSFEDIRKFGGFGGSVSSLFTDDDRTSFPITLQRARLAITLDIPMAFASKKFPSRYELNGNDFLEYILLEQTVEKWTDFQMIIQRPAHRLINGYRLLNRIDNRTPIFDCKHNYLYVRLDLRKTYFTIEFYPLQQIHFDYNVMMKLMTIHPNVHYMVQNQALLRDTQKVVLIGSYNKNQTRDATLHKDTLIVDYYGQLLYPTNYKL